MHTCDLNIFWCQWLRFSHRCTLTAMRLFGRADGVFLRHPRHRGACFAVEGIGIGGGKHHHREGYEWIHSALG